MSCHYHLLLASFEVRMEGRSSVFTSTQPFHVVETIRDKEPVAICALPLPSICTSTSKPRSSGPQFLHWAEWGWGKGSARWSHRPFSSESLWGLDLFGGGVSTVKPNTDGHFEWRGELVCWSKVQEIRPESKRLKGQGGLGWGRRALIYRIFQFPWCTYSHWGQSQATNLVFTDSQNSWQLSIDLCELKWARPSIPLLKPSFWLWPLWSSFVCCLSL